MRTRNPGPPGGPELRVSLTGSRLLHAVPMLLCSNTFSMTTSRGKDLPLEDAQWLAMNIIEVRLAEGETWYLEDGEQ